MDVDDLAVVVVGGVAEEPAACDFGLGARVAAELEREWESVGFEREDWALVGGAFGRVEKEVYEVGVRTICLDAD